MNDECDYCGAPTDAKDGLCPPCKEEERTRVARLPLLEKNPNRREG